MAVSRTERVRIVVLAALAATFLAGACSFGDAVTPNCDPTAAPNTANACDQVSECDDGNGYVLASNSCCLAFANTVYEKCMGEFLPQPPAPAEKDYSTGCDSPSDNKQKACCDASDADRQTCLDGALNPTATSSSAGGSGGEGTGGEGTGGAGGEVMSGGGGSGG